MLSTSRSGPMWRRSPKVDRFALKISWIRPSSNSSNSFCSSPSTMPLSSSTNGKEVGTAQQAVSCGVTAHRGYRMHGDEEVLAEEEVEVGGLEIERVGRRLV